MGGPSLLGTLRADPASRAYFYTDQYDLSSSRLTRFSVRPAASPTSRPTAVEPVNEIIATSGHSASAAPGSASPGSTCSRPAGRRTAAYPALAPDVAAAGAEFVDGEAVVDGQMVSARAWPDHPWMREFIQILRSKAPA